MSDIEHYPWCAHAQNMARPRSQRLIGPKCECAEHRKGIEAAKELSPMLGLRLKLTEAEKHIAELEAEHKAGRFISRNSSNQTWKNWVVACNKVEAALKESQ